MRHHDLNHEWGTKTITKAVSSISSFNISWSSTVASIEVVFCRKNRIVSMIDNYTTDLFGVCLRICRPPWAEINETIRQVVWMNETSAPFSWPNKVAKTLGNESNEPHLDETHQQPQPRKRPPGRHYRTASWFTSWILVEQNDTFQEQQLQVNVSGPTGVFNEITLQRGFGWLL